MTPNTIKILGLNQEIMLRQVQIWIKNSNFTSNKKRWCLISYFYWIKIFPFWDFNMYIKTKKTLRKRKLLIFKKFTGIPMYRINYKVLKQISKKEG